MKFLCVDCDAQMTFEERQVPGDGTFAAAFACPSCGRRIAMLANPMETQLVSALGVEIGGRTLESAPLELTRSALADASPMTEPVERQQRPARPRWSEGANARLERVPSFVRGMVKRLYSEYAIERSIEEITPEVMDRARQELGLEGM